MENAFLGEARTKALLASRFWILERSVDIQGADFLIQKRILSQNFLSKDPPRLGHVQTKYIQDANTNIYIDSSYILDESKQPNQGFFLLIHSGTEDNETDFLLTAKDIFENFSLGEIDSKIKYYIPGKAIFESKKFIIDSRSTSLSRIEYELSKADFIKNRYYYKAHWTISEKESKINPIFKFPLTNWNGNIHEEFKKYISDLRNLSYDIEEFSEGLSKCINCDDPIELIELYEEYISPNTNFQGSVSFSIRNKYPEELFGSSKYHKTKYEKLKSNGKESIFLKSYNIAKEKIYAQILNIIPPETEKSILIEFISITELKIEIINNEAIKDLKNTTYINPKKWYNHKNIEWNKFIYSDVEYILEPVIKYLEDYFIPNFDENY